MTNQDALIAEYSALRQEILQTMQMNLQVKAAALPVASAFIVYAFQAQNSLAFLAAIVILVAAIYRSANGIRGIVRVASYISTIIEPKIEGLQWEMMAAENHKGENRFSLRSFPISICIYALISIGCIFSTWWFLHDYRILNVILYGCISLILGVSFIIVSVYTLQVSSEKYRSASISRWKKLEEELCSTVAATQVVRG